MDVPTPDACLVVAAACGNAECAHALLQAGASPHTRDGVAWTPLFAAVVGDHASTVDALLRAGARVDDACPLHASRAVDDCVRGNCMSPEHGVWTAVRVTPHVTRVTPLFVAALEGMPHIVDALLAHGADACATTDDGATPLHAAVRGGHTACIASLLRHGANVNAATHATHATPLHIAACAHDVESVCQLLDAGARVACRMAATGAPSPLDIALRGDCLSVSHALVKRMSDEDLTALTRGDRGGHPLCLAIGMETTSIVTALLERGVDANAFICGVKPLARALARGNADIVGALLQGGADPRQPQYAELDTHTTALQLAAWGRVPHSRALFDVMSRACYAASVPGL